AAQAGLANAKLIISDGEGEGTDYDLLDPESLAVLSELGIKLINVNTGSKLAKINLKEYLENMESKDLFTSRSTSMKLEVTDALTRSEEIALNTIVTPREVFELKPSITDTRNDSYILLAPSYEINVSSNLGDAENPGIEWSVVDIDGNELAQPALNIGETPGEFTLAFTTPEKASDFIVTAKAEGKQDHTWNIHVPRCKINEIKDYDVWATHTHFTLEPENKEDLDIILSRFDIQGGNYNKAARENDNITFDLTELNPGTDYTLTVDLAESSQQRFTTEEALPIPNGGMEEWSRQDGKTPYWWIEYPGADEKAVWGTMNELTTSQGGDKAGTAPGSAYSAFSGTRQTSDTYNGQGLAAIISTVGWGNGNTAWRDKIADGSTFGIPNGGKCEHLTVGELYLGTYNNDTEKANYTGYKFTSRPSSISFYHKYVKRNSEDWGVAEIQLLDEDNNVIASAETQHNSGSYNLTTLNLNYTSNTKAAVIIVKFKSSGNPNCQVINNANLSSPPSANLSDGRYTGSELYIDDIELHY
ncbi:MAG: hypothetical protein K2M61_04230, partial [Muribaculaceae bacterium]|nr:hypothetical protein [Muribaculaceae bacterium]